MRWPVLPLYYFAFEEKDMPRFLMLSRSVSKKPRGVGGFHNEGGELFKAGDVIDTERPLDEMFNRPGRDLFKRLADPEPPPEDVSADFDAPEGTVFQTRKGEFFVKHEGQEVMRSSMPGPIDLVVSRMFPERDDDSEDSPPKSEDG